MVVKWTHGTKALADLFINNLSGPHFKEFAKVFVKEDEYTPEPEYGRWYRSPENISQYSFFGSFLFIQAIDDVELTIKSIHRLKECVADPPTQESQQKSIAPGQPKRTR